MLVSASHSAIVGTRNPAGQGLLTWRLATIHHSEYSPVTAAGNKQRVSRSVSSRFCGSTAIYRSTRGTAIPLIN
jgi:hypothetical protein